MPSIKSNYLPPDAALVADTLYAMLQKEQDTASSCCTNYFCSISSGPSSSLAVDEEDRMKMVDWCYKIVDECKLDRECVAMAFNLVDDFLSKPTTRPHEYLSSHKQYQLLSIAALYTVIKVHESVAFGSDVFAALSNGLYSQQEIEDMEMVLLTGLQWRIFRTPTSIQMASSILSLIAPHVNLPKSSWAHLLDEVIYSIEYAVRDYELSAMVSRPSTVALASILNALGEMKDEQARQAILRAMLFVIAEFGGQLASPELLGTKKRLQSIVLQGTNQIHEDSAEQQDEQQVEEEDGCDSFDTTRQHDSSYTDVREYGMAHLKYGCTGYGGSYSTPNLLEYA